MPVSPDVARARRAAETPEQREARRAKARAWYASRPKPELTPDERAEKNARWRAWNAARDEAAAQARREQCYAYRDAHLDERKVWGKTARDRRRARERAVVVPFTAAQLKQRFSMFDGCWMCGGPQEVVDHVKPLARGGSHCLSNLRPACVSCNGRKHATWPVDHARTGLVRYREPRLKETT